MPAIQKAGILVLSRRDPTRVLVLYRKREGDWTFPKGHVEAGESAVETAVRELREETGLEVQLFEGEELPVLYYAYPEGGEVEVRMFVGRSLDDDVLKNEFDGDRCEWLPLDGVAARLSYDNIRRQYEEFLPRLRDLISLKP